MPTLTPTDLLKFTQNFITYRWSIVCYIVGCDNNRTQRINVSQMRRLKWLNTDWKPFVLKVDSDKDALRQHRCLARGQGPFLPARQKQNLITFETYSVYICMPLRIKLMDFNFKRKYYLGDIGYYFILKASCTVVNKEFHVYHKIYHFVLFSTSHFPNRSLKLFISQKAV